MHEETTTIVAGDAQDARDDRDIAEFRQAWEERSGSSEELQASLCSESLIAELSLKFISLPADEIDSEIEDAQRRISPCATASKCLRFGSGRKSLLGDILR